MPFETRFGGKYHFMTALTIPFLSSQGQTDICHALRKTACDMMKSLQQQRNEVFEFMPVHKKHSPLSLRDGFLVLALASLLFVLLLFADCSRLIVFVPNSAGSFWAIFRSALIASLSLSALLAIAYALGLSPSRRFLTVCVVVNLASIPLAYFDPGNLLVSFAAGSLFGLSLSLSILLIGAELQNFSRPQVLFLGGIGFCLASLTKMFVLVFALDHLAICASIATGLLALSLLGILLPGHPPLSQPSSSLSTEEVTTFFRQSWVTIGCLLLCIFTIACMWGANSESIPIRSDNGDGVSLASTVGSLLAGLILLTASIATAKGTSTKAKIAPDLLCEVGPLACISLLVVTWLLQTSDLAIPGLAANSNPILGFCEAIIGGVFLTLFSRENCPPAALPFAACLTNCLALGIALLAMGLWPFLGDDLAQSVSVSLRIIFLTVVAFSLLRRPAKSDEVDERRHEKTLATRYGLSEREVEILLLLLEKRSAPYIADQLFISGNTVKTHIRRIYEKTGVHSREELIDLFQK